MAAAERHAPDRPASGLAALAARLDALTLRERAMAFVIVLGLVYAAWSNLVLAPLDARRAALQAQVPQLEADIATLNSHVARLAAERRVDPDEAPRAELERLRAEAARLDAMLVALTERLVPPRDMASVLESVLTRETSLQLLRLTGLGAERVMVTLPSAPDTPLPGAAPGGGARSAATRGTADVADQQPVDDLPTGPGLFRHGLRVEFAGGYLETLAYLRVLESMGSRFLWEGLEFEVEQYPRARVAITVYSLSLDDAWIGI